MQSLLTANHIRCDAPKDAKDIVSQHMPGSDTIVVGCNGASKAALLCAKTVHVAYWYGLVDWRGSTLLRHERRDPEPYRG